MQRQEAQISPYYDNLRHILHDLAQPLATVTGLIDLMLLELDERDKMFQEVQLISQQLEKVMQIVGEIRRMAREAADHERKAWTATRCLDAGPSPKIFFRGPDAKSQPKVLVCRRRTRVPALELGHTAQSAWQSISAS